MLSRKVDLYPLRRILQLVLLDGRVAGGAHRGLLPCDVDLKVRGGERRWSVTLSLCEFPGADPATGLTSSVPRREASKALRPDPYAVSAKSSSGRTFRSASPSTTGTLTSVSLPLEGVTSTWVMSWVAFSSWQGLRHLHLVPLPLVAAVGHIRVVGRLQRVGGHLLRVLQGHGHLAFPSIVVIVPGAPVLVFAHMALLPQQPLQQPVLLQLGSSRAMEPVH